MAYAPVVPRCPCPARLTSLPGVSIVAPSLLAGGLPAGLAVSFGAVRRSQPPPAKIDRAAVQLEGGEKRLSDLLPELGALVLEIGETVEIWCALLTHCQAKKLIEWWRRRRRQQAR